ncbi:MULTISPECIES: helix-turn-helix domain-containing protein [Pseudidiomarina]|uniref:helix-turn-helix domain-containing protein n=1 Tax=Pseudidiomarina TaxID=2800384 RepID=UPI00215B136C|nr:MULTISPECIES: XRE family transcriptional regulator [Pseudidiomarina]
MIDQAVNQAIAARVNAFRKEHHFSLDTLAKNAGISKGMLVQIEQGRANPSIGMLCKLANALGVSVADIVAVSEAPNVAVHRSRDIPTLWHGEHGGFAKLTAGTKGSEMLELWQWLMQPSERFAADAHATGTTELLFVTKGSLTVTINQDVYVLNEGDAMTAQTDVPHSYHNNSSEPVYFMMTVRESSK